MLRLLVTGLSNPEIAEALVVSINTVKTQVRSIYRKLNVKSRKEVRSALAVGSHHCGVQSLAIFLQPVLS